MSSYRFTLYVAGNSLRSRQAEQNLRRLAEERLAGAYELVIVDVTSDPVRAEQARILTTPTVVKEAPHPSRRATGDLSDPSRLMLALALEDAELERTL